MIYIYIYIYNYPIKIIKCLIRFVYLNFQPKLTRIEFKLIFFCGPNAIHIVKRVFQAYPKLGLSSDWVEVD